MNPIISETKTGAKVSAGPARLSYPHLLSPDDYYKDTPKYTCCFLIPKTDVATLDALQRAIQTAYDKGVTAKWKGQKPRKWRSPLTECDADDLEEYMQLKTSTTTPPAVMGRDGHPLADPSEIYGGCWGLFTVVFSPYESQGSCGITGSVTAVRKVRDDESFGNGGDDGAELRGVAIDDDDL